MSNECAAEQDGKRRRETDKGAAIEQARCNFEHELFRWEAQVFPVSCGPLEKVQTTPGGGVTVWRPKP